MTAELSASEMAKKTTAARAAQMVESGMKVGLGTGSTAAWLVKILGARVRDEGLKFTAVPTSTRTAEQARSEGINVVTLEKAGQLDLTIDGADEFDPDLTLIKGGGGAHLQEKIVAAASKRMVVIADASKQVPQLGAYPLPVEVIPFGWESTQAQISAVLADMDVGGRDITMRQKGDAAFKSDEGNYILDLHLKTIGDAQALSLALNQIPGVVENGLFINMCEAVIIGHADGQTDIVTK